MAAVMHDDVTAETCTPSFSDGAALLREGSGKETARIAIVPSCGHYDEW